jgi:hypothetical protein
MPVKTKKWILDTVDKLSHPEIEELRKYLEYLVWKSKLSTGGFKNPQDSANSESRGKPKHILAAINKSHDVVMEDAEALLQSIKEGKIPIQFDSAFDESIGK